MFGMSSTEFWEEEPQLYWAYRFSYEKKIEMQQKAEEEKMKFVCWLQGKTNELAFTVALNNALNKRKIEYPDYNKLFTKQTNNSQLKEDLEKKLEGVTDKNERGVIEFNHWARL